MKYSMKGGLQNSFWKLELFDNHSFLKTFGALKDVTGGSEYLLGCILYRELSYMLKTNEQRQ